jgi:hypothetical protein
VEHRPTGTRVLKINIAGSQDFRRAFEEYLRKLARSAGHLGLVRLAEWLSYRGNFEPQSAACRFDYASQRWTALHVCR